MVRDDLPRGIQAAQIVHAAGESSPGNLSSGTFAVVLSVPNEQALCELRARLSIAPLAHVGVYEPDAPWNNALMAIGIVPGRKEVLRRHLSGLALLK